jgi:tetratricopeptide (TPR) repeat protein
LAFAYLALDRLNEARSIIQRALARTPDDFELHLGAYSLASLQQDAKVMEQQVAWASGKPWAEGLFLSVEAQTSASYGKLAKARELFKRSVAADQRDNLKANATSTQGAAALWEAEYVLTGILPLKPLAYLGVARARTMSGDVADARTAYQDFLALWKDADPDIPVLKQAKTEYAKLQ